MIRDSGDRQVFETGAVRDISAGKGRCDLMPLGVAAETMNGDEVLGCLAQYQENGDEVHLFNALITFMGDNYDTVEDAFLDLSVHFEEGAEKYGMGNWNGLPDWTFLSSAVRHYLKFKKGMADENHERAFMWNIVCLIAVLG
ncbi:hypothetical protein CLNEO_27070 [Anaerotignum neopropionicum]|uniref:dATP/dGTP diphosphohydrolase N-terminal domain-containing protein n=1 Tax=Anaerotignum neopropionicum TaxID=36847 RepID=A0A136WBV6_9FIRM|nr:dATP/dGTP diphosphohydrolase domain-containing protein [Anaerotignum neopropionicum]KXL52008.1 hypothetical protein CLNEO_27070 [Anaerotignum neopropionicum]